MSIRLDLNARQFTNNNFVNSIINVQVDLLAIYMPRNFVLCFVYWRMQDVFHVMNILVCEKFMYDYQISSKINHHEEKR